MESKDKKEVKQLREQGLTYTAIGKKFGISKQAIHQLLHPGYRRVEDRNQRRNRYHTDPEFRRKQLIKVKSWLSAHPNYHREYRKKYYAANREWILNSKKQDYIRKRLGSKG